MGDPDREHEGASLTGRCEGKTERDVLRHVKMACKWVSLSIGVPLGNLKGIRLPGLSE